MKQFQMENTNMCQAMNSPRGEISVPVILSKSAKKLKHICFTKNVFYLNLLYVQYNVQDSLN